MNQKRGQVSTSNPGSELRLDPIFSKIGHLYWIKTGKTMAKKASTPTLNFEYALNELETMIGKMETGQLSLEDSLKNFEEGVSLARQCQQALKEAELKVQILVEQNGQLQAAPFAMEEE